MINIPRAVVDDMIAHARAEDPNECCGIIAGTDSVGERAYRITNTAKSPYRYLMDPQEFLDADKDAEANGWSLLAFYHSHTHSAPYPSQTDVRMAQESGWLDPYYVLVSLENKDDPEVRLYNITADGEIVERDFSIA